MDFGALAFATNLSKMLAQDGCPHTRGMKERDLEGPADLGATSHDIRRSVPHFMKSFRVKLNRVVAEARRAEVSFFDYNLFVFVLGTLLLSCYFL